MLCNLQKKLRMIFGRKVIAIMSACALAVPVAGPAAAYDEICFRQKTGYTTNGIHLRNVSERNTSSPVWSVHMTPYITAGLRKCVNVRGRMTPGDVFNIVQDVNSGPDRRCHADGGRADGTYRWPEGGGTMELEGHGSSGNGRCKVVAHKMWIGCGDDALGGFAQVGCQDWEPELTEYAAYDHVLEGSSVAHLRSVLERGADPNLGRYDDETPLHAAVRLWRRDHIDALLVAGADPMNRSRSGNTVLWALLDEQGHREDFLDVLKRMLEARVSLGEERNARMINEGLSSANGGVPGMINVVLSGRADVVDFALKNGGDAAAMTYSRYSALHHAAKRSLRMVRLLLNEGADPDLATRDGWGTPLHWAVHPRFAETSLADGSRADMAATLLQNGANPDAAAGNGQTPLHYAARIGDFAAVANMLNHGANPNLADNRGKTALHHARAAGHAAVARQLLKRGADPELEDHNGDTPAEVGQR